MSIGLIIFLIVLFVIAMILTFYAFKQEEMKMKQYKEAGNTVENELKRSHEYESTSIKKYIPIQIWIYVITTILSIIMIVYFFMNSLK
jgi:predicted PurR-regulated permease PerM